MKGLCDVLYAQVVPNIHHEMIENCTSLPTSFSVRAASVLLLRNLFISWRCSRVAYIDGIYIPTTVRAILPQPCLRHMRLYFSLSMSLPV